MKQGYKSRELAMFSILMLFAFAVFGQVEVLPDSYHDEYRRISTEIDMDRAKGGDKVYLDPIEQIAVRPSEYGAQNTGNYAPAMYGIPANEAWIKANAKRKVVVFTFDTAGDFDERALDAYEWPAMHKTFTGEGSRDGHGHGTHVASCIVGRHPQGLPMGPASVLGDNIKVVAYKVLSDAGWGYTSWIVDGGAHLASIAPGLIQQGWFVIANFSLGSQSKSPDFDAMTKRLEDAGVLVIAAAGNSAQRMIGTPANGKSAHSIAAVDQNKRRASFSNWGPEQYAAAPGVQVYGCWKGGYAMLSGTSMAAPTAAAMAAITGATHPKATARQVSHFLADKSQRLGAEKWDEFTGYGLASMEAIRTTDVSKYPDSSNGNPDTPNPPYPGDPDNPDEPDPVDPDPDPVPVAKRKVEVEVAKPISVTWMHIGDNRTKQTSVLFKVSNESTATATAVGQAVEADLRKFFANWGFALEAGNDELDLTYWVRHFLEMLSKREGNEFTVLEVAYISGGNKVVLDKPRRKMAARAKVMRGKTVAFNLP